MTNFRAVDMKPTAPLQTLKVTETTIVPEDQEIPAETPVVETVVEETPVAEEKTPEAAVKKPATRRTKAATPKE